MLHEFDNNVWQHACMRNTSHSDCLLQGRNAGAQNIPSPTDDVISDFFSDLGLDDTERAPGPMDDQEAEVVLDKLNLTGTVVRKCYLMAQHYSSMVRLYSIF